MSSRRKGNRIIREKAIPHYINKNCIVDRVESTGRFVKEKDLFVNAFKDKEYTDKGFDLIELDDKGVIFIQVTCNKPKIQEWYKRFSKEYCTEKIRSHVYTWYDRLGPRVQNYKKNGEIENFDLRKTDNGTKLYKLKYKRIKGFSNYIIFENGKVMNVLTGKIKSLSKNNGYKSVALCKENKTFTKYIHRLVAKAFISNPENKKCVNHKDGNKLNNSIENLEWVSRSENNKHAFDKGLINNTGENHGYSKLTEKDIVRIRELCEDSIITQKEIGKIYGICQQHVSRIKNNENWTHL